MSKLWTGNKARLRVRFVQCNFFEHNKYFFKMFRYMKPYGVRYAITQFIYSAQGFAMPFILSIFIGNIMAAVVTADRDGIMAAGITLGIMLAAFLLTLLACIFVNILLIAMADRDMRQELFRKFMHTGLENAGHSGEGIATINTDAEQANNLFSGPLMMFMSSIITIAGSTVVIFAMDWRLGLASLAVGIISFILQNFFTKPLAEVGKEQLEANAEAVKSVSNVFSGAMSIRAYNIQPGFLTFDRENNRLRTLDIRRGLLEMGMSLFRTIEGWLTLMVVFGFGGWLAATGRIEFYTIAAVFVLSSSLSHAIGSLGSAYAGLQPNIAAAKRVFAILERPTKKSTGSFYKPVENFHGYNLRVENLCFRYLDGVDDTLKNVNLQIGENKMVALVGESGSGKSTLLRAVMGMYQREDMGIGLGGVQLGQCPPDEWRKNFAYVDQSAKLFDMTIAENIAMGLGGNVTQDEIEAAAKLAMAHDFIVEQEEGYSTSCGEGGGSLSGGQKQRIAIARALVKKAPVLLFDEATSALDAETEAGIMDTINSLRNSHTILYTTHNMANAAFADTIVVMENGEVVEMGSHDELIKADGVYARLCG